MSIKDEAFDRLDEWNEFTIPIRDDPKGMAADLSDELNISLKTARELVSKWLDLHRPN